MTAVAKTSTQRNQERRQKAGRAATYVILSPVALASLDALVARGMTKTEAICKALTVYAGQR